MYTNKMVVKENDIDISVSHLPVFRYHVHPRRGTDFHKGVWYEDNVHAVEHAREHRVPQPRLPLEVQHTHHVLALGVIAGHGQHSTVC